MIQARKKGKKGGIYGAEGRRHKLRRRGRRRDLWRQDLWRRPPGHVGVHFIAGVARHGSLGAVIYGTETCYKNGADPQGSFLQKVTKKAYM